MCFTETEEIIIATASVVSKAIAEKLAPITGRKIKFSTVNKTNPATSMIERAFFWPVAVSLVPIHWRSAKSTGQGDNSCR